jgi:hypothetical protein
MAAADLQIDGSATPEEAAAIAVAIDLFVGDTAPVRQPAAPVVNPWFHAGILEATGNDDYSDVIHPPDR